MNKQEQLSELCDFQQHNTGTVVQFFNQLMTPCGERRTMRLHRNEFGDVDGASILESYECIQLFIERLVLVETLSAGAGSGPCQIWSYPDIAPRFNVDLRYRDIYDGPKLFYATNADRALRKALWALAASLGVPTSDITEWFAHHPDRMRCQRLTPGK